MKKRSGLYREKYKSLKIKAFKEETDKNETRNRWLNADFMYLYIVPCMPINTDIINV